MKHSEHLLFLAPKRSEIEHLEFLSHPIMSDPTKLEAIRKFLAQKAK
jgi:hypothetical protein